MLHILIFLSDEDKVVYFGTLYLYRIKSTGSSRYWPNVVPCNIYISLRPETKWKIFTNLFKASPKGQIKRTLVGVIPQSENPVTRLKLLYPYL